MVALILQLVSEACVDMELCVGAGALVLDLGAVVGMGSGLELGLPVMVILSFMGMGIWPGMGTASSKTSIWLSSSGQTRGYTARRSQSRMVL
jgi:hypothetical protein